MSRARDDATGERPDRRLLIAVAVILLVALGIYLFFWSGLFSFQPEEGETFWHLMHQKGHWYLEVFISETCTRLLAGARFAVITFHSLEDRIVKHAFRALAQGRMALQILTKRPIVPGDTELDRNPRSRSAKLRAVERLA